MGASDKFIGFVMVLFRIFVFGYYTTWVIITPFIVSDHWIQQYFLPREYGIIIPLVLLVVGITAIGTFLGLVMIKSKKNK
ncbi:dolichyl-phosphate mannosyltransferase 2 regulatory subunit [Dictyostelium discoideum AX4]|uniref:Dolichol phosphate-mannose biosynthesis regulatory protein n=1 Tax=Dictyostelium discoideum TaxID=44689 RepID=DPM2_DICDI|nr:dolichyl-phosphate mannosyltransferase 2 regulatory subunit [Dictyostelium discoideum AX4]XP_645065.1 dolichyl-phosphate mannosyltransferase 2 regulatory subunit [Dictyostelium discoideum AX4]Q556K9.1 RecName: Full=Dolichol phosphate-mannose biosynthesis regulatory protein; AltName: Full=Dolichol-phosphate mannose synthase subunit 2; Short=DPM synthase subunit 2 [Dictyostelium discoideum]EAL70424.1 dolichyl-phosphate mannosyltransferase 2 regulatory subunit [Dictyostelium discoideum AX4]EAL7|eukprot:XP_644349.1 dolichyl-phosphate mannosyltransferase 2 regulatory subunit [Dictyostelium discoideum AX4]